MFSTSRTNVRYNIRNDVSEDSKYRDYIPRNESNFSNSDTGRLEISLIKVRERERGKAIPVTGREGP
jgi:hypothetical protein